MASAGSAAIASETFCSWFFRTSSSASARSRLSAADSADSADADADDVAPSDDGEFDVLSFTSKMRAATSDMSSAVVTSGRSDGPLRVSAFRRRRTFAMPMSGHGPFSFWQMMGRSAPRKETRFTACPRISSSWRGGIGGGAADAIAARRGAAATAAEVAAARPAASDARPAPVRTREMEVTRGPAI